MSLLPLSDLFAVDVHNQNVLAPSALGKLTDYNRNFEYNFARAVAQILV